MDTHLMYGVLMYGHTHKFLVWTHIYHVWTHNKVYHVWTRTLILSMDTHTNLMYGGYVSIHGSPRMCPYNIELESVCPYNRL